MTTTTANPNKVVAAMPLTALDSLGRHWHVEHYVSKIAEGCVGSMTASLRHQAEAALRAALSYDY